MSETLPEAPTPRSSSPPREIDRDLARKNMLLGWALFLLALAVFGGTIGVAFIYLAAD